MKLIIGLGNPGVKYRNTRHNLGSLAVEEIAKIANAKFKYSLFSKVKVAKFIRSGKEIILLLPMTFMNLSGKSVSYFVKRKNIPLEDILVICDDANLTFGRLRFRPSGSDGGHNGLKSIVGYLKTDEFSRLRIGVGSNSAGDLSEFILSEFKGNEKKDLADIIGRVAEASLCWIDSGIASAMNKYN